MYYYEDPDKIQWPGGKLLARKGIFIVPENLCDAYMGLKAFFGKGRISIFFTLDALITSLLTDLSDC